MTPTIEGRLVRTDAIDVPIHYYREPSLVDDDALLKSIQVSGIEQPLVLIEKGDGRYMLVDGSRRLEIAQRLGHKEVPATVETLPEGADATDHQNYLRFIIDECRQDLRPSQKAKLIQHGLDTVKITERDKETRKTVVRPITQKEMAARLGWNEGSLSNWLAINRYIPEIVQAIDTGEVTLFSARAYDGMAPEAQARVFKSHRKEMAAMSGGEFHRLIRSTYPPSTHASYYTDPAKTKEKLARKKKGRRTSPRPRPTIDQTRALMRSLDSITVRLADAKTEHQHMKRCCTTASQTAAAWLRSEKIMATMEKDGKTEQKERIEVFSESY